jgi:hypothetical protein
MFAEHNENVASRFEEDLNVRDLAEIDVPLRKTHEYIYHFTACDGRESKCRLAIYEGEERPPVIVCAPSSARAAPGHWAVECLAAEVVRRHFPQAFEAVGEPFVWLERRRSERGEAPARYLWVTFDSYAPRCVEHAHGVRHVALKQARRLAVDRTAVETLIGQALLTEHSGAFARPRSHAAPWPGSRSARSRSTCRGRRGTRATRIVSTATYPSITAHD